MKFDLQRDRFCKQVPFPDLLSDFRRLPPENLRGKGQIGYVFLECLFRSQ